MNVKGAPASGKSTMRPLQKALAGKLNLPWVEFALISPDIWRKFLLDYAALGPAYKYAGTLTGHELEIIDRKLDRRMANRAAKGEMPHLLIDRFRFDSFVPNLEEGSRRLLTRFGDLVYMFFMITPPEMTVERAWTRGLKVGRYKAVEDILEPCGPKTIATQIAVALSQGNCCRRKHQEVLPAGNGAMALYKSRSRQFEISVRG
jgi:hypothetical protein